MRGDMKVNIKFSNEPEKREKRIFIVEIGDCNHKKFNLIIYNYFVAVFVGLLFFQRVQHFKALHFVACLLKDHTVPQLQQRIS